jgi:glutaredoxin-related protein
MPTLPPKTIAIVQSNYIPWKGYFDLIARVDEFILYDDMQYTRRDWRNRNLIKTAQGPQWLTIPVDVKGKYLQRINETQISDANWADVHWKSLVHNYARTPFFAQYKDIFQELYATVPFPLLSHVNYHFISAICQILGITTKISWSSDYILVDGKTERLVGLCQSTNATRYISGPAARDYIVDDLFTDANITLEYADYSGYPPYPQLYGEFTHGVSVLDLIFNVGPQATTYMKYVNPTHSTQ